MNNKQSRPFAKLMLYLCINQGNQYNVDQIQSDSVIRAEHFRMGIAQCYIKHIYHEASMNNTMQNSFIKYMFI